jgi:acyl-CoA dehydrogenase
MLPSVELGEDYAEVREGVRAICSRSPGGYWRELDETRGYPSDFIRELTEAGYLSALIPEEYGGSGLPLRAASVILEEIQASGCYGGTCHAQMYIMGTLLRHGSPDQKKRYLPRIASGEMRLQAFGVTEPTTGSDTTQLRTRAVRDGDRYLISGQKVFISRTEYSDIMLVLARTTDADKVKKRSHGLSVFILELEEAKKNGLEIKPIRTLMNHHSCEIYFDEVPVPAENLIGEEDKGFRYILDGMNAERLLIGAECVGDARWFIKTATQYANDRVVFDRPIGKNQGIQFPLARAHAETEAADLMVRSGIALFEAGLPCGPQANMAKLLASEASWHAGEAALNTLGGFGFAAEYDVERKWRETRLYQAAPISNNLVLSFVGEHVLGMPRSY